MDHPLSLPAGSTDQSMPGPAGRLSVMVKPWAAFVPPFASFKLKPIAEPEVTTRASALFDNESEGSLMLQDGNLNEPMRVCHWSPVAVKYSVVYQSVQSSTGSATRSL